MQFIIPLILTTAAAAAASLASGKPMSIRAGIDRRQEPEYYDGYAYQTPDVFSVNLWLPQVQDLKANYSNLVNISTSYGGQQTEFNCVTSQQMDPANSSQWLTFVSPNVPGSDLPVLQSNVSLFPGNMCSGTKVGLKSFDETLLDYADVTIAVNSSDICQRWTKVGGYVTQTGPVARCVLELTPI